MVHETTQICIELSAANSVYAIKVGMGLHVPPTPDLPELFHRGQITTVKTKCRLKFMQTALVIGNGSTVLETEQNVVHSM
jgi:hypothetical protein